jgi:hypothetical protein
MLVPTSASPQDLFELEVFRYETTPAGDYDVELHANAMSRGTVVPSSASANHRPVHLSVEVARGWTNRFETALFVQTAPFASSGGARLAGGHLRSKIRLGELPRVPLRAGLSMEYTFNRSAFDHELQTLELRSIFDYGGGRLSLVANPSIEFVTRGSDEGLEPVLDLSARAAWQLFEGVAITTDYFSAAATTRHLRPELDAHHLVFAGTDFTLRSRWELGVSVGHCLTSAEPWLMKSVIGYRF